MAIYNISNLSISFNKVSVLKDLSFQIQSTGLTAIVGKSGCGKSTLLNLLLGIEKPTSGKIEFMSRDVSRILDKKFSNYRAYDVSTIFQHYNLLSGLTAFENVILPLHIRGDNKKEAKEKTINLFKQFKLEKIKNQKVETLSGGEKQRVAILRAIITNPKAILCDEPTGALDSQNAHIVMDMLKDISATKAVIIVSHNLDLVNKYADRIITLQDGKIVSDMTINEKNNFVSRYENRSIKTTSWNKIFVKKYFKSAKFKNILGILSISFGYLCLFLTAGFINGSNISQENAILTNNAIGYATASIKTSYEIENSPFTFEKSIRPSISDIDNYFLDYDFLKFEVNLDYAFSSYPYLKFDNHEINGFQMVPLLDDDLSLDEVFINSKMAEYLKENSFDFENSFKIDNIANFSFATNNNVNPIIKDDISYSLSFRIKYIVDEFSFLNTPKVYYSYQKIKEYLNTVSLENISRYRKENYSVYRYIENVDDDDQATSYAINIFVQDKNKYKEFLSLVEKNNDSDSLLQIDSTPYDISKSYSDFISSFANALIVFVVIAFIGVNLIIGILGLSLFVEHKKEAAILTCLGAKNSSIISIFLDHNLVVILIAFLLALAFSFPLQTLINNIVYSSFNLSNIILIPFNSIYGFPFLLPIGLLLIGLILSTIFVFVPIFIYRKLPLSIELRDE